MMKTTAPSPFCPRQTGFTLVEIAIVLLIVAILLGGLLPTISSQVEQRRISDTRKQMDEIQQALIGYAISYGHLPCPAKTTLVTGVDANAGQADCTLIAAASTTGVIPWATLGTSETDAWGRRFTYTATNSFITPTPPTFTLASIGNLQVMSAAAGGSTIASNLPAVIVSHGSNGCGAYTPLGTQITPSNSQDEKNNSNGGAIFVSHDPTATSDCSLTTTYDDLVAWVSPNILFNRMVTAGKLP